MSVSKLAMNTEGRGGVDPNFEWYDGPDVSEALLRECSELFGKHYGTWGPQGPNPGQRVRQPTNCIKALLNGRDARLVIARKEHQLVAYAAAVQPTVSGIGKISWVTQLVVHEDFRKQGIATWLLFAFWQFSDQFAWGLVTANPFAVRALEKATRRRVQPSRAASSVHVVLDAGFEIPYIKSDTVVKCADGISLINTAFFVDHKDVPKMLQQASVGESWLLGDLPDGWEWFAFTFKDQDQVSLSSKEIEEMLKISDEQTALAYARMTLDDNHKWQSYAEYEAEFVWKTCGLSASSRVLDLGCGNGRHALALWRLGASAVGVDYVGPRIEAAREAALEEKANVHFLVADARDASFDEKFDCVLCLYDVVGSHANHADNFRIVKTAAGHVTSGGFVLISAMNLELTEHIAKQTFSLAKEPDRLLSLRPGTQMETSGDVFQPDYFMLDPDDQIVYRKEQFTRGSALPAEMLVRDRRYRAIELEDICIACGLEVVWSKFVALGDWDTSINAVDIKAKEILVLCRMPATKS